MSGQTKRIEAISADFSNDGYIGFLSKLASWLANKTDDLLCFEQVLKCRCPQGRHDAGLQTIAVEKIVGSVGRCHDFDKNFYPRRLKQLDRWRNIDRLYNQGITLPPVQLYKLGDSFFVFDGHCRISVARARGQVFIDAYVTEFEPSRHASKDDSVRG